MYTYVRARQLEGSYPGHHSTGCYVQTCLRILRGWGDPGEAAWPYDGSAANWPPQEPPGIERAAKAGRICAYQRVRSLEECKLALTQGRPVQVALEIVMADWQSPPGGIIKLPTSVPTGVHAVLIIGYDDDERSHLNVRNSWGVEWGDKGNCYIDQIYFERFQQEAWITQPERLLPFTGLGVLSRAWSLPDCFSLDSPLLGIEIYDGSNDECVGWAFLVKR
jgi:hypothetical protein